MSKIAPPQSRSLRILLVEDHNETLQIFARLLRHFGHEISVADCALSALQLVESKEFDLVLSDILLPDGSGYHVVSQAKRKQPVKAVALTALGTEEDIRRSKEAGFDFHFTKPVDFYELRAVLNQVGALSKRPCFNCLEAAVSREFQSTPRISILCPVCQKPHFADYDLGEVERVLTGDALTTNEKLFWRVVKFCRCPRTQSRPRLLRARGRGSGLQIRDKPGARKSLPRIAS